MRSRGQRSVLEKTGGSHRFRLADLRSDGRVGRRHPHVAMIGIVIRGIVVCEVNGEPVVRSPGMLAQVVVDEVPEHAKRLNRDERHDDEQRDQANSIGW